MWIKVNQVTFDKENNQRLTPNLVNTDNVKLVSDNGEFIRFMDGCGMWIDEDSAKKLVELLVGKE